MAEPLLPARFLFRFAAPCAYRKDLWSETGVELEPAHRLALFDELEDRASFAEVRCAWNEDGLAFWLRVTGKRQATWCHEARIDSSDGLRLWIDTRDTHNIHRASRFCHQFIFLPAGAGLRQKDPVGEAVLIHRARENPKTTGSSAVGVRGKKSPGGYVLSAFIPASALSGYDPAEHPRLGFQYAVFDREQGRQTFSVGSEFPYESDPSTWGTLELVK